MTPALPNDALAPGALSRCFLVRPGGRSRAARSAQRLLPFLTTALTGPCLTLAGSLPSVMPR